MNKQTQIRLALKADADSDRREVLLADKTDDDDTFIVRSIPAFIYGVALGDSIQLTDEITRDFVVTKRSGQVTVRLYVSGTLDCEYVKKLIEELVLAGGQYEVGFNRSGKEEVSLLLISVGVEKGFPWIESLMNSALQHGDQWEYGNIYGEDGNSINWWQNK